jgi:hypothetical protein
MGYWQISVNMETNCQVLLRGDELTEQISKYHFLKTACIQLTAYLKTNGKGVVTAQITLMDTSVNTEDDDDNGVDYNNIPHQVGCLEE